MFDLIKALGITKQELENLTGEKLDDTVNGTIEPPSSEPPPEAASSVTPDEDEEIANYGGDTTQLHD